MSDDFLEHINPVHGSPEVDPVGGQGRQQRPQRRSQTVNGQIVSIRRGIRHAHEQHVLDLSVGGDETTEIVIRVPPGAYANLEGKRAILYIEE